MSQENTNPNKPISLSPLKASWSSFWPKNPKSLKNALFTTMKLHSGTTQTTAAADSPPSHNLKPRLDRNSASRFEFDLSKMDPTLLLNDEILLLILSKLPRSQLSSNSLVCKRWLNLQGRLVQSLKVFDWEFLESGRLVFRFPNLTNVDLIHACMAVNRNSGILLSSNSNSLTSIHIDSNVVKCWLVSEDYWLADHVIDLGLKALASACPNLRKLVVIAASELGFLSVAEECPTLQELELHKCSDKSLRAIAACENLQILKLIGTVDGLYSSLVSDIGLTIVAQGCERLVKLELSGCEGSFDGIKAIGQCCQMLEELTFCDHRMAGGWLAALSYCENLKTLKFQSCKEIDKTPRLDEYIGSCGTLERLHIHTCQLRNKRGVRALFIVGKAAREIVIRNCWGLDNDVFKMARTCRSVKSLSLEGCSLLTTEGLESVILPWKELQSLKVVSCKHIRNDEVSQALSKLFTLLQDLTWRPDTKSHLSSVLKGTCMGKKGAKFLSKSMLKNAAFAEYNKLKSFRAFD